MESIKRREYGFAMSNKKCTGIVMWLVLSYHLLCFFQQCPHSHIISINNAVISVHRTP